MSRSVGTLVRLALASIAVSVIACAQNPPEFEVASVRPNLANDRIVTVSVGPGGRFAARGYTLVLLIQRAYGVMDWNVSGGPRWIRVDRFDIEARANVPGGLSEPALQPMLQRLLEKRFKLRMHKSSTEVAGYELAVARGGPKFKPAILGRGQPDTFRFNADGLSGEGIAMPDFARFIAGKLGVIAVDKTGLDGFYDLRAQWAADTGNKSSAGDRPDDLRFTVFSAIHDQLGLSFIHKKITVQMLVIDEAERASAADN